MGFNDVKKFIQNEMASQPRKAVEIAMGACGPQAKVQDKDYRFEFQNRITKSVPQSFSFPTFRHPPKPPSPIHIAT